MKRILLAAILAATIAPAANAAKVNPIAQRCEAMAQQADQAMGAPLGDNVYSACMQGAEHGRKGDTARRDKTIRILNEQAATMNGMDRAALNYVRAGYQAGFNAGAAQR